MHFLIWATEDFRKNWSLPAGLFWQISAIICICFLLIPFLEIKIFEGFSTVACVFSESFSVLSDFCHHLHLPLILILFQILFGILERICYTSFCFDGFQLKLDSKGFITSLILMLIMRTMWSFVLKKFPSSEDDGVIRKWKVLWLK